MLAETARQLAQIQPDTVVQTETLDINNSAQISALARKLEKTHARLDVLVNAGHHGPLVTTVTDDEPADCQ